MSERDNVIQEARDWMSAKETGNLNYLATRLARALLDMAAENERLAKSLSAQQDVTEVADHNLGRVMAERNQLRAECERMRAVFEAACEWNNGFRERAATERDLRDAIDAATKATP